MAALLLKSMIKDPTEILLKSRQNYVAANVLTAVETTTVATVTTAWRNGKGSQGKEDRRGCGLEDEYATRDIKERFSPP